ncbi:MULTISPECIES: hypothetical protein [unclassified Shewanella]|uniref:hypothetical protein n=1 Tax=unclassified Shewanella TaxID=196818 RepID=UPI0021D90321|nr:MULTISPECIES: hypothetical protein [unclassified Shewanella]MCU8007817.1 hypothetical protein [Shewanella sp. SM87]MCU8068542.1 hypothetical protein [Shewanella sp. SM32]
MNDKDTINIELPTIGVTGIHIVEKRLNGDVVETRTGSFTHKHVSCFYLVVEDALAKQVIDIIAGDWTNLPMKYIYAGAWGNQAACLFGFLMYAKQLENSNVPHFSILAIDDGDIKQEHKDKRLNGLLKGNYYGDELKAAKDTLSRLMLSFKLEYLDSSVAKGLPEYNHKKWFEEIDQETILSVDSPSNLYEERQVESLLELIEFSKTIILDDYHLYYDELKKCQLKNTLNMFHMTEYFILTAIKKYNNEKWLSYTAHIKEALDVINTENTKNFVNADIYFKK